MNDVSSVSELTQKPDDIDQRMQLIAWRSLVWAFVIAIASGVLCVIGLIYVDMWIDDGPLWQFRAYVWSINNFFGPPICIGGFFLALMVRHRWFLQSVLFISVFLLLPIIPLSMGGYEFALHVLIRILSCYAIILLLRFPARWIRTKSTLLNSSHHENLRFGFATLFWGSTLVALSTLLVINAVNTNTTYKQAKMQKEGRSELIEIGAKYDEASNHFILKSNSNNFYPQGPFVAWNVAKLGENSYVEFIDCEITDETMAHFKELRTFMKFGRVVFQNCKVVKEGSPTGHIKIGNELNEPLPSELP